MKKRTFYSVLLLFLLFLFASVSYISIKQLRDSLSVVKERCLAEHYILSSSLIRDIQALEDRQEDVGRSLTELMNQYARFSQNSDIALALYKEELPLYDHVEADRSELRELDSESRKVWIGGSGQDYLYVAGRFTAPYQEYILQYRYSLEGVLKEWKDTKNRLILCALVVSALLSLCLLFVLSGIFRPLNRIAAASLRVAAGHYDERLSVKGRDELAGLAKSFNHMAGEIEGQMEALNLASRQKQNFIDNFAHELRTPLTAIYGYAEYVQRAVITDAERTEAMEYIMSESRRLQNLACQLLELATMREEDIEMEQVELTALLRRAEITACVKAQEGGVQLVVEPVPGTVLGNRELLESLLVNLLDNAIKASGSGSTVKVLSYVNGGKTEIQVKDEGRGMTSGELEHIMEAFYRADKSRSRKEGGAGLGLSICESIAALHHAQLGFWSEPGKGTCVSIIFTA